MNGLIGRKVGMTQVFDGEGRRVPVTVIEAGPCVVVSRKTQARDGYEAAQLGFEAQKEQRVTQPLRGVFKRAGVAPRRALREFTLDEGEEVKPGDTVTVAIFEGAAYVDVIGISKGQGFQGVMKRHRMRGGPMTHGGHSKRRIGAVGCRSYPGRIHKGHRMPGHMGHRRVTQQNLRVVQVRGEDNVLLVRGAVPGPAGGLLMVRKALKRKAAEA
ncbi:MAG: 50S ribosomal protein L3 [Lentisphaerae bacterium]|nr:50S ribosomal protein L3 [Lentisphaerota bacterium]